MRFLRQAAAGVDGRKLRRRRRRTVAATGRASEEGRGKGSEREKWATLMMRRTRTRRRGRRRGRTALWMSPSGAGGFAPVGRVYKREYRLCHQGSGRSPAGRVGVCRHRGPHAYMGIRIRPDVISSHLISSHLMSSHVISCHLM